MEPSASTTRGRRAPITLSFVERVSGRLWKGEEIDLPGLDTRITELAATTLYGQGNTLTTRWIPGYVGVEENELADRYARQAAKSGSYTRRTKSACPA